MTLDHLGHTRTVPLSTSEKNQLAGCPTCPKRASLADQSLNDPAVIATLNLGSKTGLTHSNRAQANLETSALVSDSVRAELGRPSRLTEDIELTLRAPNQRRNPQATPTRDEKDRLTQ